MSAGNPFAPPPEEVIAANVDAALAEDIGPGDATASLLDDIPDHAYLLCKEDCVVAGRPWFDAVHRALDPDVRIDWRCSEGDRIAKGTVPWQNQERDFTQPHVMDPGLVPVFERIYEDTGRYCTN